MKESPVLGIWEDLIPVFSHTLWIGAVIAILLALVLKNIPASRPNLRYLLSLGALSLLLCCGMALWAVSQQVEPGSGSEGGGHEAKYEKSELSLVAEFPAANSVPERAAESQSSSVPWQLVLGWLWAIGVVLMLVRFFASLAAGHRLRREVRILAEDSEVSKIFEELTDRIGVTSRAVIRLSGRIAVPVMMGIFQPVILWPASWMTGLEAVQIRAILAHELAHIRRHDYLVNLLQMLVEAILFFNPAVWWISSQIRNEREACCDAVAAEVAGGTLGVAKALSAVVDKTLDAPLPVEPVLAIGKKRSGILERIKRLLDPEEAPSVRVPWRSLIAIVVLFFVALRVLSVGAEIVASAFLDGPAHIAEIAEIEEVFDGAKTRRAASGAAGIGQLSGTVVTFDGKPLPPKVSLRFISKRPRSSSSHSDSIGGHGNFYFRHVPSGSIQISASAEGYAPAIVPGFSLVAGESVDGIEITLKQGFSAEARVTDESGIPQADVEVGFTLARGDTHLKQWGSMTDADGRLRIPDLVEGTLAASIERKGFQFFRQEFDCHADRVFEISLRKAILVDGKVTAAATGEPLAKANIILLRGAPGMASADPWSRGDRADDFAAIANADGEFTLDTLPGGHSVTIWVEAEGYRPEVVHDVIAGMEPLHVALSPAIEIDVKIEGPLDSLVDRRTGVAMLRYAQNVEVAHNHGRGLLSRVPVEVKEGVGVARLNDRILPGSLTINAPFGRVKIENTAMVGEFTIDLREDTSAQEAVDTRLAYPPMREVVLHFKGQEGWPVPDGSVEVGFARILGNGNRSIDHERQKIVGGKVSFEVPLVLDGSGEWHCDDLQAPGFWMERLRDQKVEPGAEPLHIDIETYPAGVIFGTVVDEDSIPVPWAGISMKVMESPADMPRPDPNWWNNYQADEKGRFMISPVPIGGVYRPECTSGAGNSEARFFAEPIRIDKKNPRREIKMILPKGDDLTVLVVDEDGRPIPAVPVALNYNEVNGGLSQGGRPTNSAGRIVFKRVNLDLPVEYYLIAEPTRGFAAAKIELNDDSREVTMTMPHGHHLEGILLDDESGKPLANEEVRLNGKYDEVAYARELSATTDFFGRFAFTGLESCEYSFRFYGKDCSVKGVTLPRNPSAPPLEVRIRDRGK